MAVAGSYSTSGREGRETAEGEYWTLERCKRAYLDYLANKRLEIEEQKQSRCYRHGAQWTPGQVEVFNARKQPVVTFNRIGRKIDSIVGLMEKLKQDPKAFPRNPRQTDELGADLATATVRYVVEADLRESKFPLCAENGAVDGIAGVEMMLVKGDKGDKDIGFALVRTDSFFYDPRSYDHDFEDARYMGQGKWLDMDDAMALAPDETTAEKIKSSSGGGGSELTSLPDREKWYMGEVADLKQVRVVDIWYKMNGAWKWCMFTGSMKIQEGEGYFFNEKGDGICKYIMFSSFVDQDGDRYGFVRTLRSSQDEINQRRSKGLHELVSRRIKAEDGAFPDIEVARREAVRPDGVVIYNKGFEMEFDDQARIANIEGQLKFLEDAKNEIENFGPSPALIGQGLEYKSGRAINLLQQAGIAELGPFVIGIKNWKLRLYRAIWSAAQRYWTSERWIRVTDVEGLPQMIQLNGLGIDPMTGIPRLVNAVGQLDVNFVLDEGPDEVNMMGDAYDTLVALTAQGANIPPTVLLELAPLQGQLKRKLLAMVNKEDPIAEQAKGLAIQGEAAKVEETKSKTALNFARAQSEAQGGERGAQEIMLDAAIKRDEHQMKMAESQAKVQTTREMGRAKLEGEFAKLQSQQIKSAQDVQMNEMKGAQALRQGEDKHQQAMRQQAAKTSAKAAASPPGRQSGGPVTSAKEYLVGEAGPELLVGRDGSTTLVGADGPEKIAPDKPGYVLPAGTFSIPFRRERNAEVGRWVGFDRATEGLKPGFKDALTRAFNDMPEDVKRSFVLNEGFRTRAYQDYLYSTRHTRGMVAPGGHSRHEIGEAVDVDPGPARDWLRTHGHRYGLTGIRGDDPHIQLAGPRGAPVTPGVPYMDTRGGPSPGAMVPGAPPPAGGQDVIDSLLGKGPSAAPKLDFSGLEQPHIGLADNLGDLQSQFQRPGIPPMQSPRIDVSGGVRQPSVGASLGVGPVDLEARFGIGGLDSLRGTWRRPF